MAVTVEKILTSVHGFGLLGATPLQRAICRAVDGLPLGELADHPDVLDGFGGPDAIEYLRTPGGRPFMVYLVASTRSAKSVIGGAIGIRCALEAELETGTSEGDTFEVPIIATKKKKAKIIFKHLLALMKTPAFRPLLAKEPTGDTITIRRPNDGKLVDIVVTAGSRGGGASIGTWCCALILDEAARMISEEEAVVNIDETIRYALSRIRPGGQIVAVTSPWAPMGNVYDAVQEHHGKPTLDMLVVRGKGPQMNPVTWTPEACAKLQRIDPIAYETDVLGNFAASSYGLFSPSDLARVTRTMGNIPPEEGWEFGAAIDPGTRSNAWTLVISGRQAGDTEAETRYRVFHCCQWQGSSAEPLRAKEVFADIALILTPFGLTTVLTDQWGYDPFREHAEDAKIDLELDTRTTADKTKAFKELREHVISKKEPAQMELPGDRMFHRDMLNTRRKLTPEGEKIEPVKTSDGRHADYSPAWERSCYATTIAPTWIYAMKKLREQRGAA